MFSFLFFAPPFGVSIVFVFDVLDSFGLLICLCQPFVNEILGAGNSKLASVYIPKCTDLTIEERVELWTKCGLIAKAGEEAVKAKNLPLLEDLRQKATGQAATEIERMIGQLRRR